MATESSKPVTVPVGQAPLRRRLGVALAVGAALGALVISSWALYHLFRFAGWISPPNEAEVREVAFTTAPEFEHPYRIRGMSITLTNRLGNQVAYAQFTLVFDCPDEACLKEMLLHRARIRNAVFESAADLTVERFRDKDGFEVFKLRLMNAVTKFVTGSPPRQVALADWVMN